MEEDLQNNYLDMITFRHIPYAVLTEMAKYLDTCGEAGWEALADSLGYAYSDIRVISYIFISECCCCYTVGCHGVVVHFGTSVCLSVSLYNLT